MEDVLLKTRDWQAVEEEPCRVLEFTPLATVANGEVQALDRGVPYASVNLQCPKLPAGTVGYISHKMDFYHLWAVFRDRGVRQDEEVLIFWSKRQLKGFAKLFSPIMPRLCVMVCPAGAYEVMTDDNSRPELTGEARFLAMRPIIELKPPVWK
jgi:hypothetical protein